MHYFSNLVISVATLLEPVVASLTAVALGVGDLPGWKGWLGNLFVIVGTLAVVYRPSESKRVAH
jgi:drug/metabolite transporter (DMT)-like permease